MINFIGQRRAKSTVTRLKVSHAFELEKARELIEVQDENWHREAIERLINPRIEERRQLVAMERKKEIDRKGWYFRGGKGWYFNGDKSLPPISQTPSACSEQTEKSEVQPHTKLQERMVMVKKQQEKQRTLRRNGILLLLVTVGALAFEAQGNSSGVSLEEQPATPNNPYHPCEFSEELKWEKLELGEGLGSLAVRTVEGVDWGICDQKATLWIRAHNPRLVNGHDSQVVVPESVTVVQD